VVLACRHELSDARLAVEAHACHFNSLQALFDSERDATSNRLAATQRRGWAEVGVLGARRDQLRPAADAAVRGRSASCRVLRVLAERGRAAAGSGAGSGRTGLSPRGRTAISPRPADSDDSRVGRSGRRAWTDWSAEWGRRVGARLAVVEAWAAGMGDEMRAESRTRRADCLR
jgi:hypothetical protein